MFHLSSSSSSSSSILLLHPPSKRNILKELKRFDSTHVAFLLLFGWCCRSRVLRVVVLPPLQRVTCISYLHSIIQFNDLIQLSSTPCTTPRKEESSATQVKAKAKLQGQKAPPFEEEARHHQPKGGKGNAAPPTRMEQKATPPKRTE